MKYRTEHPPIHATPAVLNMIAAQLRVDGVDRIARTAILSYADGLCGRAVARTFNLTESGMVSRCNRAGVFLRPFRNAIRTASLADYGRQGKVSKDVYDLGWSSPQTASRFLRSHGYEPLAQFLRAGYCPVSLLMPWVESYDPVRWAAAFHGLPLAVQARREARREAAA